jgi:hypothetical protein
MSTSVPKQNHCMLTVMITFKDNRSSSLDLNCSISHPHWSKTRQTSILVTKVGWLGASLIVFREPGICEEPCIVLIDISVPDLFLWSGIRIEVVIFLQIIVKIVLGSLFNLTCHMALICSFHLDFSMAKASKGLQ